MQRIKAAVALMLALVWLPAASCCLIDASGLLGKRDCCSKEHPQPAPGPGNCDQPCGALASATFLPQQSQLLVIVPIGVPLFDCATFLREVQRPAGIGRELPATAPPELAGHDERWKLLDETWQLIGDTAKFNSYITNEVAKLLPAATPAASR